MESAAFVPSEDGDKEEIEQEPEPDVIPKTKEAKLAALQDKLREALDAEEYERAAKLRDDIKKLTNNN